MGDSGYYLLWADHQHQGLLQSRDVGRRCFWTGDANRWLDGFPEGYFELSEIHQEFTSGEHHSMFGVSRPDVSERNRMQIRTGELNHMYGRKGELHPSYRKKNPGVSESNKKRTGNLNHRYGIPNSDTQKQEISKKMSGRKWWVNPEGECRFDKKTPGPDWQHGRKWKVG
jgi:hypothetical protein